MSQSAPAALPTRRGWDALRVIALFKFGKALLLLATLYGVHRLLEPELMARLQAWTASLTDSFGQRMLTHALAWAAGLGSHKVHLFYGVTAGYLLVVLCEGTGLWLRWHWAEWLTLIATASMVPFELYELAVRPRGHRLAVLVTLVLNVLILCYLTYLLRRQSRRHALRTRPSGLQTGARQVARSPETQFGE